MDGHLQSVVNLELEPQFLADSTDKEYNPESDTYNKRYNYNPRVDDISDEMPSRCRHVRHGLRSIRPEIYRAAHTLNSEYHMSIHLYTNRSSIW